ncbi:MAG: BatD family protein [Porphyromonadaceae bacterium]|nr:BatD family protein [Porphyromonadaceae bacterium]
MKRLVFFIITIALAINVNGQKVEFVASAPQTVVSGQPFQLQYTINSAEASKLTMPRLDDFELLNGPATYTSTNYTFINGKSSQTVSTTYTYVLSAKKTGNFSIAPASITVDGKQVKSNTLTIKVLPPDSKQQSQGNQNRQNNVASAKQIGAEDIFIRPILSKTTVKEQEMVLLTYKVYYKVDLVNIVDIKMPDFDGFLTHNIEVIKPQDIENYNGQNYYTSILRQMLVSPQRAGKIVIKPMTGTAIIRLRQSIRDPRSFFNSYDTYQDVKKQLSTGTTTINVVSLPEPKPSDFSGAVGSLSMTSSISSTDIDVNNSITLKLNITGTGNLKLIKTPQIEFPADFEQYDPKVDNNFSANQTGFSGNKSIEYIVIPRHNGTFEIPPVTFTYFDLTSNSYKTLTTERYNINVVKGAADSSPATVYNGKDQEQVKQISSDIQYIKTGNLKIRPKTEVFAGSLFFWLCLVIPLFIAILLGIIFNKKAKENANIALVRNKKANKVATKRLKVANQHLKVNQKEQFYDEMLAAIWLYLSDKLNIPLSTLNKENALEELRKKGVADEISNEAIKLLTDCEFERYAYSNDAHAAMDNIYNTAVNIIEKIENSIKR